MSTSMAFDNLGPDFAPGLPHAGNTSVRLATVEERDAAHMIMMLPRNPERSVGFRKLLEAKDCAMRALLYK